jgi:hypothetical protein
MRRMGKRMCGGCESVRRQRAVFQTELRALRTAGGAFSCRTFLFKAIARRLYRFAVEGVVGNNGMIMKTAMSRLEKSDNFKRAIAIIVSIAAFCIGVLWPIISYNVLKAGLVNQIAGSIYGLGFYFSSYIDKSNRIIFILLLNLSFIIWPIFVSLMIYYLALRSMKKYGLTSIVFIAGIFGFLMFFNVPFVNSGSVEYLPIFSKYIDY